MNDLHETFYQPLELRKLTSKIEEHKYAPATNAKMMLLEIKPKQILKLTGKRNSSLSNASSILII